MIQILIDNLEPILAAGITAFGAWLKRKYDVGMIKQGKKNIEDL